MKRMTLIADDSLVSIDGKFKKIGGLQGLISPDVHALQWYETWGEVEFKPIDPDGDGPELPVKPPNQKIRIEELEAQFGAVIEAYAKHEDQGPDTLPPWQEVPPAAVLAPVPVMAEVLAPQPDLTQPIADMEEVLRGLIVAVANLSEDMKLRGAMIDWIMENGQSVKGELLKDIKP